MSGTIVVHCKECGIPIDWDPLSEDEKICDDCKEYKDRKSLFKGEE